MKAYSTLKGVLDILQPEILLWNKIEEITRAVLQNFGYTELRIPIIESTELFIRGIGETSDIVSKEMYTFNDRAGRSISLRPEGTASLVRSYIEHGLNNTPQPWKYYYIGPMFRYERPQKGRFRQFYQIGAEFLGNAAPVADAEIISMIDTIFKALHLPDVTVEVNTTGCRLCRPLYRDALVGFFTSEASKTNMLCDDCKVRLVKNPLRVLDCKVPTCIELRKGAPLITEYVCDECREHDEAFKGFLNEIDIKYVENPEIVRGLDYYTKTAFEFTTEHLGAQKAVAAGGRYDNLVADFGGPKTPAVGFAIGVERLAELLRQRLDVYVCAPLIFFAVLGKEAQRMAFKLSTRYRQAGVYTEIGNALHTLKNQLKRADKMAARFVIIIGEEEINKNAVIFKDLVNHTQEEVPLEGVLGCIKGKQAAYNKQKINFS